MRTAEHPQNKTSEVARWRCGLCWRFVNITQHWNWSWFWSHASDTLGSKHIFATWWFSFNFFLLLSFHASIHWFNPWSIEGKDSIVTWCQVIFVDFSESFQPKQPELGFTYGLLVFVLAINLGIFWDLIFKPPWADLSLGSGNSSKNDLPGELWNHARSSWDVHSLRWDCLGQKRDRLLQVWPPTFTESNSDSTWAFKPRCFFPSPLQQLSSRWWDDQRCVGIKTLENSDFLKKNHHLHIFFWLAQVCPWCFFSKTFTNHSLFLWKPIKQKTTRPLLCYLW